MVSKLQLSSSAVSWPYIAICPMELWVMLQSIMGKKKKIWDGYPPLWTDRLMDRHVSKHYLPVVLRTRAVKILKSNNLQIRRQTDRQTDGQLSKLSKFCKINSQQER